MSETLLSLKERVADAIYNELGSVSVPEAFRAATAVLAALSAPVEERKGDMVSRDLSQASSALGWRPITWRGVSRIEYSHGELLDLLAYVQNVTGGDGHNIVKAFNGNTITRLIAQANLAVRPPAALASSTPESAVYPEWRPIDQQRRASLELATDLRSELAQMAAQCSVPMELWGRFSNHVLEAAQALERVRNCEGLRQALVAARGYLGTIPFARDREPLRRQIDAALTAPAEARGDQPEGEA